MANTTRPPESVRMAMSKYCSSLVLVLVVKIQRKDAQHMLTRGSGGGGPFGQLNIAGQALRINVMCCCFSKLPSLLHSIVNSIVSFVIVVVVARCEGAVIVNVKCVVVYVGGVASAVICYYIHTHVSRKRARTSQRESSAVRPPSRP